MEKIKWDPGRLLQLSGSYWQTFTLHAGVKLDIFSQLAKGALSAAGLAERLHLDLRGATMILNALAAMQLIEHKGGSYHAGKAALRFLDRSSPDYIGHMIMHHHYLADSWARMHQAVRSGKPVRLRATDENESKREAFLMGMYTIASQQAPQIAALIDLSQKKRLLDLGGGPGTYAIAFCKKNEMLEADVVDLATTRIFAEKTISRHNLTERIRFVAGDYVSGPISGTYDVVWVSHILHAEAPAICEHIIQKAVNALESGGTLLVHDFILDNTMDGPLFPALFALNMLQGTDHGQTYSENQIRGMLRKAGIIRIQRLDYCGPTQSGILQGIKNQG